MRDLASAINRIFWGLIFVIINVNIIYFDIFPDFIGYFMILAALSKLQSYSVYFSKAKIFAVILALYAIPLWFIPDLLLTEGFHPSSETVYFLLSTVVHTFLHIGLIYMILCGLIEIAEKCTLSNWINRIGKGLRVYVYTMFVCWTIIPFVLNMTENAAMITLIGTMMFSFIMELMIIVLIRKFRNSINSWNAITLKSIKSI